MMRQPSNLRIPSKIGVGETVEKDIHNNWNTIDEVEAEIEQLGVEFQKPKHAYPGAVTAEQLTTPNSEEYTQLYTEHLAWFNYLSPIKARVDARLIGLKNEMTDIELAVKASEKTKNKVRDKEEKVTLKDATWNDARYKSLNLEAQRLEQKSLILGALLESINRNLFVISRQVTIRGQDIEQTRLEHYMTARPTGHRIPDWKVPRGQGGEQR